MPFLSIIQLIRVFSGGEFWLQDFGVRYIETCYKKYESSSNVW